MAAPVGSVQLHGGQSLLEAWRFPDLQHRGVGRPECLTQPCIRACNPGEFWEAGETPCEASAAAASQIATLGCSPWLMDTSIISGAATEGGSQSGCFTWLGQLPCSRD